MLFAGARGRVVALAVAVVLTAGAVADDALVTGAAAVPGAAPSIEPADTTGTDGAADVTAPADSGENREVGEAAETSDQSAASRPAAGVAATRTVVDLEEPQDAASAVRLVGAANGRGNLLVGAYRPEGDVPRPAIWESLDGLVWAETAAPAAPAGSQYHLDDLAWVGTQLVGVGNANAGTGPRAAVWLAADGHTFGPPEQPAGDEPSTLAAVAAGPAGPVVAGTLRDDGALFVATRDANGAWTPATLPDIAAFSVRGMASSGTTVVITGVETSESPPRAAAVVSVDGGVTFTLADTTVFDGDVWTGLGPVVATAGGFVAVACAPAEPEAISALARSADGATWTRQDLALVGPDATALDLHGAGCNSVTVEGDVVHLGLADVGAWRVAVAPDGSATPVRFPRFVGQVPTATPLLAASPQGLLGVGRDSGGFIPSLLATGQVGVGLPMGRPLLTRVTVDALSDTLMISASLYPLVTERPERNDYTWRATRRWFESADGASATPSFTPETIWDVETSPFGDLAFGFELDPADAGTGGPANATAWYARGADRVWTPRGLLASGPGGEQIQAGASSGATTVAIGQSSIRDAATNVTTTRPLALVTTDGQAWTTEDVPLDAAANGTLESVCAVGEQFVALGSTLGADVHPFLAVRDDAGGWTVVSPEGVPAAVDLEGCAALDDTLVVFSARGGRPAVYRSEDVATFRASDTEGADFAGASFADIEVLGGRFVAVGTVTDPAGGHDGAVWTSEDGLEWQRLDVEGLGGPGDQRAQSVAEAPAGAVVLSGTDNGAAVLWTLPT